MTNWGCSSESSALRHVCLLDCFASVAVMVAVTLVGVANCRGLIFYNRMGFGIGRVTRPPPWVPPNPKRT